MASVLAIDVEGKRYFNKFAKEQEIKEFKYIKSLDKKKLLEIEKMR